MKNKPSVFKTNFVVLKYVFKFCPNFIYFSIAHIIASVVKSVSKVLLISKAIDLVVQNKQLYDIYELLYSLGIYTLVIIVCSLINVFYENYISSRYQLIYQKNIQRFLYSKVKIIDMESYDDPAFYDRFTRGCRESSWRGFRTFKEIINLIIHIATSIALGTYILINDKWLILLIIGSCLISMIVLTIIRKVIYKTYRETENERRYQWYVNRTFYSQKNAAELKTTTVDMILLKKYRENTKKIDKKFNSTYFKLIAPESIGIMSRVLLSQAGTYIFLLYRLFNKLMDISAFTATANATLQFASSFERIINIYSQLKENLLYIEDFIWALNYQPVV